MTMRFVSLRLRFFIMGSLSGLVKHNANAKKIGPWWGSIFYN